MIAVDQSHHMQHAIRLALQGLGRTAENPSVGCVILDAEGNLVAVARTADGGRPHAETSALEIAGDRAKDGTAFVTLEPCSHTSKTGPCAQALIDAGLKSAYIGIEDPDPRVSGRGIEMLKASGIEVEVGICAKECRKSLQGFLSRIERKRPFVTVKIATTLDSKTALANGKSKWITGPLARQLVHQQRARSDAIMVGAATVLTDKPSLDVRLCGQEKHSPRPIVLDTNSTLTKTELDTLRDPLVLTSKNCETNGKHLDLTSVLSRLANEGINTLYVESGGNLATALLRENLIDRLIWFRSTKVFGADSKDALTPLGLTQVNRAPIFKRIESRFVGEDLMEVFEPCSQD